jgi:hypothetical protein
MWEELRKWFWTEQLGKNLSHVQCYMPLIPTTQEVEIKGLKFKASPGKKLVRPHVNHSPGVVAYTCHDSYTVGIPIWDHIRKIKQNGLQGVAQFVEYLTEFKPNYQQKATKNKTEEKMVPFLLNSRDEWNQAQYLIIG